MFRLFSGGSPSSSPRSRNHSQYEVRGEMAAETNNPLAGSVNSGPSVSCVVLTIAGLKVNVYGLSELPEGASKISCLWLHHPRLRSKDDMTNIADQILAAYHQKSSPERGLIAVAFDQRNHGSRLVDARANDDWRSGNPTQYVFQQFRVLTGHIEVGPSQKCVSLTPISE